MPSLFIRRHVGSHNSLIFKVFNAKCQIRFSMQLKGGAIWTKWSPLHMPFPTWTKLSHFILAKHPPIPRQKTGVTRMDIGDLTPPRISLFCRFSAGWPGLQACTKRIKLSSNLKEKHDWPKSPNGKFLYQFLWDYFFWGGGIFQRFGWRLLSNIEIYDRFCLFIEQTVPQKSVHF